MVRVEVFKEVEKPGRDDKYKSIEELWFVAKAVGEADERIACIETFILARIKTAYS